MASKYNDIVNEARRRVDYLWASYYERIGEPAGEFRGDILCLTDEMAVAALREEHASYKEVSAKIDALGEDYTETVSAICADLCIQFKP